jgi:hypothetical protein
MQMNLSFKGINKTSAEPIADYLQHNAGHLLMIAICKANDS